jgi:glutamate N-acetyltransferase/amino-acid N-acetyltransferase
MKIIKGGVTSPKGFLASGVKAGIKKSGRLDLALLYSEVPAVAAASFTKNRFRASPVNVSSIHLRNKHHQAVIVNSGNANCANGAVGDRDAVRMAELAAKRLGLDRKEALVASTGIIGHYLPMDRISAAMPKLVSELSKKGGSVFARAIMTTDTVKKECAVRAVIGNAIVTIGGACKGVGMLYPDMKTEKHPSAPLRAVPGKRKRAEGHATMLCFITTDASITRKMLESSLEEALDGSFNMVSVDADMSTNDSCFMFANGLSGNRQIAAKNKDYKVFTQALKTLCADLAKALAADGEGATKFVEIEVKGAKSLSDARAVARKISASSLLKCAIYGADPNWGRVAAAAGAAGVDFDPGKADIYLGGIKVLSDGRSVKGFDRAKAAALFRKKSVSIKMDLKSGPSSAKAWTCDFSKEYVVINSEYST